MDESFEDSSEQITEPEDTFYEDDSNQAPPSDIVAFNELRSCADLVRMHRQKTLELQPEFQRHVVWKAPSQTRFIDSLIKGLPVPSMCFSHDYSTGKWQVIDGLQRITSIIRFLDDDSTWRLSRLDDIDPNISGKSVREFRDENSQLFKFYGRVQDITIPINVIRCDSRKPTHSHFLFTIFHRLNTGGMRLTNQEIRNCIYTGKLNRLLLDLAQTPRWEKLFGTGKTPDRFQSEELILRFFAFFDDARNYNGRLAKFLNEYMRQNRNPSDTWLDDKRQLFAETLKLLSTAVSGKYRETTTILEAVMFGIGRNISFLSGLSEAEIRSRYVTLKADPDFQDKTSGQGLSAGGKVIRRLAIAKEYFSK